jgi:hypothetical protein
MDPVVLVAIVALATLLFSYYAIRRFRTRTSINPTVAVSTVVRAGGLVLGAMFILSYPFPDLRAYISDPDVYALIGGFGVMALCLQGIQNDVLA